MKLKIKDKIFLGIATLGLIILLYNKITGKDKNGLSEENAIQQTESEKEIKPQEVSKNNAPAQRDITLGQGKITVRMADTDKKKYQGLSDIESMGSNEGMLFVYPQPGFYSFEMRRMNFDLDFVFIRGDEIVDIKSNVSKNYPDTISGDSAYDGVLELNAGTAKRLNILIGDKTILN